MDLTVLCWNIGNFNNQKSMLSISRLINNLDCDIICLQESYDQNADIYHSKENEIDERGGIWFPEKYNALYPSNKYILNIQNFFGTRSIISKYPFIKTPPPLNNIGVFIKVNRKKVFICNVHLPAYPFQLEEIEKNNLKTYKSVIESSNNARGDHIDYILDQLNKIPTDIPILLLGDFNEPSHLDHLPFKVKENNIKENSKQLFILDQINFPTSKKIFNHGFVDSMYYILRKYGHIRTWNALKMHYKDECETHKLIKKNEKSKKNKKENHVNNQNSRIDFIYFRNKIRLLDFRVVTNNPTLKCKQYPSDHYALYGKYKIMGDFNNEYDDANNYIYLLLIVLLCILII
jgi:endonuclease/exonuclease/phosphatase family metal-dependent hydrolase